MEEKQPKPKKSRKKKPTMISTKEKSKAPAPTPTPDVVARIKPLSAEESKMFLRQINEFLGKKTSPQKKEGQEDYKILYMNISEFLESFITIGYTFDGQRVLIQHYPSPRDRDAMMEFLKNVFISNNSKDVTFFDKEDTENE